MSTRKYVLLEEVSGCPFYLRKMLQCPFNKTHFLQNLLDAFTIINTHTGQQMQYSKQKCNIPFLIRVTFLWGNAVCFCRYNIHKNMNCSFKGYTMPFEGCLTFLPKQQYIFLFRKTIFVCTLCSIVDIEHPSQRCNIF